MFKNILILFLSLTTISTEINAQNAPIFHKIKTVLEPSNSFIDIYDSITIRSNTDKELTFNLNSSFVIYSHSKNIELTKIKSTFMTDEQGMDRDGANKEKSDEITQYKLKFKKQFASFFIKYKGNINSPIKQSMENYQRGFSESSGIISDIGVYLAGSTNWVPDFQKGLLTYTLDIVLPENWKAVSQGDRTSTKHVTEKNLETWICNEPQEEVFLIAAKFFEYSNELDNKVKAMAFLRTKDDALAGKYLEVTEQYMAMYEKIIGKFPYSKFALVENFWETGYGMPSFTLLGEKIIRFPFILHSSYPHELLHNWWGNSVYVDFKTGNWCEGLTAYLADYLIKEMRGQAVEYRRNTLQKYVDFVSEHNDFPLINFASRHDASSEAVGYGKSMMFFHMLRNKMGDENFIKGLQDFYEKNKFSSAGFDDIRISMEKFYKQQSLNSFFDQWLQKKGAPKIELYESELIDSNKVKVKVRQISNYGYYTLEIPVYLTSTKGTKKFNLNSESEFAEQIFSYDGTLERIDIDPFFDLFRIVDPDEVPPALSKILGSNDNILIIPSQCEKNKLALYSEFAEKWKNSNSSISFKIIKDDELANLPKIETAWIIGSENRFFEEFKNELKSYSSESIKGNEITSIDNLNNKDEIITVYEPSNHNKQLIFININNEKSLDGLIRKLPHYGKYGYLGFEGDEPVNFLKGQWLSNKSPLTKLYNDFSPLPSDNRTSLGELKPAFSKSRLKETVDFLASEKMKGRGIGSPEIEEAAQYLAEKFKQYGLKPMNDSYFQEFKHDFKEIGDIKLKNVIGYIEGTDAKLKNEPVVLSAHFDHLGLGWPDVKKGNEGKIHYGADDNASGVAILLELAKALGDNFKPKRSIIFAAFTAEEAGLIGSRYFVNNPTGIFNGKIFANINLDTDGKLFAKKLLILNANTAREWKFIFMGTDYTTGVLTEIIDKDLDASDQVAFIEKQIPSVQLFAGTDENYHSPGDTPEKLDYDGMVKIASVTKEVLEYLSERSEPMNFTGSNNATNQPTTEKRSASTGAMPDFTYDGKGMKIASVSEGSAGFKAGLQKDDIVIKFNGVQIENLKSYSNELKKYKPGDEVILNVLRNGKLESMKITLGAR